MAAWTTDWEKAEANVREMEHATPQAKLLTQDPAVPEQKPAHRITIGEAVEAFLDDEQGRQLRKGTTGQSNTLLRKQLIPWARQQNLRYLNELTVSVLTRFRAYWSKDLANSQNTARRKHERLCGFFHFCIRSEWTDKNPARLLKPIKVHRVPTGYFTRDEFARIIDATYAYGNWKGGHDFQHRGARLRALLLLMRWGGLAITDAVTLERDAFPWDTAPRFLLRDRDSCYGEAFHQPAHDMEIDEVLTAPRSPWQNAYVERLIGSIRRECLDHVMVFSEHGLSRILKSYFEYYEKSRTHLSLAKDAPIPRSVQPPSAGKVIEIPQVGGLHHRYERRAA